MFERAHHRDIALVLQALEPRALAAHACWFGGGTAMALRYGEYRESVDIDFLVSDLPGYRGLRQALGGTAGLGPLTREGMHLVLAREVRADQYGIRTQIRLGSSLIKFEIVLEARIALEPPSPQDAVCGVASLRPLDLAAEKLLANADRWADDAVWSRDLIDLAMQGLARPVLLRACVKAEAAYGDSVRVALAKATRGLRERPGRLAQCMQAMAVTGVSPAQLWGRIQRVAQMLATPPADAILKP